MNLKEFLSWRGIPSQQDHSTGPATSPHADHLPLSRAETALEAQHFRTPQQVSELEQQLELDLLHLQESFSVEITELVATAPGLELVTPVTVDPWAEQRRGQYFEMSIDFEVTSKNCEHKQTFESFYAHLNEHTRSRGFQILYSTLVEKPVPQTSAKVASTTTIVSLTVIRSHFS